MKTETAIDLHVHIGDNTYNNILLLIIIEHYTCPDLLTNTYDHHRVALCYRLGFVAYTRAIDRELNWVVLQSY